MTNRKYVFHYTYNYTLGYRNVMIMSTQNWAVMGKVTARTMPKINTPPDIRLMRMT